MESKKDILNVSNFLQMVSLMNSEDNSSVLNQFDEYLIKMDLYRNLNHKETFKELLQLWEKF